MAYIKYAQMHNKYYMTMVNSKYNWNEVIGDKQEKEKTKKF